MFGDSVAVGVAEERDSVGALANIARLPEQSLLFFVLFRFWRFGFGTRFRDENIAIRQELQPSRADEVLRKAVDPESIASFG